MDGDYGFWAMAGAQECNWDVITRNLGKGWYLLQAKYKSFPACGAMQSPLGALTKLIIDNDLKPEEIQQLLVKSDALSALPQYMKNEIYDHFDAQNSFFYNMSVVVHRVKVGPAWQTDTTLANPSIIEFMKKVKHEPYAKAIESSYEELSV